MYCFTQYRFMGFYLVFEFTHAIKKCVQITFGLILNHEEIIMIHENGKFRKSGNFWKKIIHSFPTWLVNKQIKTLIWSSLIDTTVNLMIAYFGHKCVSNFVNKQLYICVPNSIIYSTNIFSSKHRYLSIYPCIDLCHKSNLLVCRISYTVQVHTHDTRTS